MLKRVLQMDKQLKSPRPKIAALDRDYERSSVFAQDELDRYLRLEKAQAPTIPREEIDSTLAGVRRELDFYGLH